MLRGVFGRPPEPFSGPARPILRPGRFLVMWGVSWSLPVAEIPHEVDRRDDGTCSLLGHSSADVPLLAAGCSLGDSAVRSTATAVLERPAEGGHEGPELGDAAAVLVACHELMVAARAEAA